MTTDEARYRAETFRIIGIAMLAPAGSVLLTPSLLYNELGLVGLIFYIFMSILSLVGGSYLLEIGRRILYKKEMQKWR